MIIQDGTGGGYSAKVTQDMRLLTHAVSISPIQEASLKGDAFSWNAINANIDTGDTALLVRNDSTTQYLVIDRIYVWTDVSSDIDIHLTDGAAFTPTGTAVTGVCLNRSKPKTAQATAKADETANTQGNIILTLQCNETATDIFAIDYDLKGALILDQNDCVAVDIVDEPGAFECTIWGYYIDK